jgi:hypothetical protein
MPNLTEAHYRGLVREMLQGRVVPFLGAGANMCGRPRDVTWTPGRFLPNGAELAAYLASNFDYPHSELRDLLRVSQYVAVMTGSGPLYEELHELFDVDYPPNRLHELLVGFPRLVRARVAPSYQLIVTTNYDDSLERAFRAAGEEFECVYYLAEGEHKGKFQHLPPDGECQLIERPNEYRALSLDRRTVILKLHGAIDRLNPDRDSYVITEDHYIDYLTRTDLSNLIPVTLAAKLRRSHFLFLGYSLRDWNLRVILHRIWGAQALTYKSWAIQLDPQPIDEEFWRKRNVDLLDTSLEEYVDTLTSHLLIERDRPVPL